jgi:hypothetical protein
MPAAGAGAFFTGRPVKNVPAQDAGSFSRKMPWIRPQPTSYATPRAGEEVPSKTGLEPFLFFSMLIINQHERKVIISFSDHTVRL